MSLCIEVRQSWWQSETLSFPCEDRREWKTQAGAVKERPPGLLSILITDFYAFKGLDLRNACLVFVATPPALLANMSSSIFASLFKSTGARVEGKGEAAGSGKTIFRASTPASQMPMTRMYAL